MKYYGFDSDLVIGSVTGITTPPDENVNVFNRDHLWGVLHDRMAELMQIPFSQDSLFRIRQWGDNWYLTFFNWKVYVSQETTPVYSIHMKMRPGASMFYTYYQNNSGGFYDGPKYVIVEAGSAEQADAVAVDNGVYFDGVRRGRDSDISGDRWLRATESHGKMVPMIYGDSPAERVARKEDLLIVRNECMKVQDYH